jgi:cytochrome P450 monooxygenase
MNITLIENAYVLVRLMREFEKLENRDPVQEFVERTRLTTESRNGVKVGLISTQNVV